MVREAGVVRSKSGREKKKISGEGEITDQLQRPWGKERGESKREMKGIRLFSFSCLHEGSVRSLIENEKKKNL